MKAFNEYRKWINKIKSKYGKGYIGFAFDNPVMERKLNNSKKNYKRHLLPNTPKE